MVRRRRSRETSVEDFRHAQAQRKNNPPAGIAPTYEARERRTQKYAYDPHLDPQLQWAGKAEHTSFEVDVVSLHIHERISTRAILDAVRRPVGAKHVSPLLLLVKEGMAGKVQRIYMDPPYDIKQFPAGLTGDLGKGEK